jgi:orotidine-5'-phosphate decarboxylase
MLEKRWNAGARVCVGLDSDKEKIPKHLTNMGRVSRFNIDIVELTRHTALAYKPNIAFYSGDEGGYLLRELQRTVEAIRALAPEVPIILDAKRADIGNTNRGYVEEAFKEFDADAVTVNPYFGMEAMKPFLDCADKGIIILCKTSNPGAGEFQDLPVSMGDGHITRPLYQVVASQVAQKWNYNQNCALVVGATYPEELAQVRRIVGDDMWLLVPGFGKQGGDVEKAVRAGINSRGRGIISNSSSGIIFASTGKDYADVARDETKKLTAEINRAIESTV